MAVLSPLSLVVFGFGPMLIHVRLLEAMLGPYSSHVELMLSQERRVPFKSSNFEVVTRWEQLAAVGPRSGFSWVS